MVFLLFPLLGHTQNLDAQSESQQVTNLAVDKLSFDLPVIGGQGVYIKVVNACNHGFSGDCLNVRSGPGTNYPIVKRLRNYEILRVDKIVIGTNHNWYRLNYDNQHLYYPERVETEQYIAADYVTPFITETTTTTWENGGIIDSKKIVIDRSEQALYAYEGDELFMKTLVSTGKELAPTEIGTFEIFKKMPSRYMQGPIPGSGLEDEYDLEGVPWNMYFTAEGSVLHGAYWHNSFGSPYSHGCVNLKPDDAKMLYDWANLGTKVIIQG